MLCTVIELVLHTAHSRNGSPRFTTAWQQRSTRARSRAAARGSVRKEPVFSTRRVWVQHRPSAVHVCDEARPQLVRPAIDLFLGGYRACRSTSSMYGGGSQQGAKAQTKGQVSPGTGASWAGLCVLGSLGTLDILACAAGSASRRAPKPRVAEPCSLLSPRRSCRTRCAQTFLHSTNRSPDEGTSGVGGRGQRGAASWSRATRSPDILLRVPINVLPRWECQASSVAMWSTSSALSIRRRSRY